MCLPSGDVIFSVRVLSISSYFCVDTHSGRKVCCYFFCENFVVFNEAHLHKTTLNVHTHIRILSRLSIASVDDKQHLSAIVFSKNRTGALNTNSLKCYLLWTDAIDRQEKFTYVYEVSRSSHASALYWNPLGFCKTKRSETFVTEWYIRMTIFDEVSSLKMFLIKPRKCECS